MDDPSRDQRHGVPAAFASIWKSVLELMAHCWIERRKTELRYVGLKINNDLLITVQTAVDSFHDKEDIFQMQNLQ